MSPSPVRSPVPPLSPEKIDKLVKTVSLDWKEHRAKLACLLTLDGVFHRPVEGTTLTVPQLLLDLAIVDMGDRIAPLSPETVEAARTWLACRRQKGSEQRLFVDGWGRPMNQAQFVTTRWPYKRFWKSWKLHVPVMRYWPWWVLKEWVIFDQLRASYAYRLLNEYPDVSAFKLMPHLPRRRVTEFSWKAGRETPERFRYLLGPRKSKHKPGE